MTPALAMIFGTDGPMEWIVIALAVLLLFGSQRLPDTMRTLGRLSAKLYRARDEFRKEFQKNLDPPDDAENNGSVSRSPDVVDQKAEVGIRRMDQAMKKGPGFGAHEDFDPPPASGYHLPPSKADLTTPPAERAE